MLTRPRRSSGASTAPAHVSVLDGDLTQAARDLAGSSARAQSLPKFVTDPAELSVVAVILARPLTRPRPAAGSLSAVRR